MENPLNKQCNMHQIAVISMISIVCKLIGFIRELVMAHYYGTSLISDVYVMAITIPGIVFGGIAALTVGYTPIYKNIEARKGCEEALLFTNKCLVYVFLLCVTAILFTYKFPGFIVDIVAPGYGNESRILLIKFLKSSIFHLLLSNMTLLFTSYLNCKDSFIPAALSTLLLSSIQIFAIVISINKDPLLIIYGHNLSYLLQLIVLFFCSLKKNYRFKPAFRFDNNTMTLFHMVIPVFFSQMTLQINSYVDKAFSSVLGEGKLSGLTYAHLIINLVDAILVSGIITVYYPNLSKWIATGQSEKVKENIKTIMTVLLIFYVPIVIGLLTLSPEIVNLVFATGNFNKVSVRYTAGPLAMYSLGLIPLAVTGILNRLFYANRNTKTTLWASVVSLCINIIMNFILIKRFDSIGLAFSSSFAAIAIVPIYIIKTKKEGYAFWNFKFMITGFKIFISGILMLAAIAVMKVLWLPYSEKIYTIFVIVMAGSIYFILVYLLKVDEVRFLFNSVMSQLKKNK